MQAKMEFRGTGGELFKELFVGALLCGITLGIYTPWYLVKLYQYVYRNTKIRTEGRELGLEFGGSGGELFKILFVGGLLTSITFGVYAFWMMVDLIKFYQNNSTASGPDGRTYRLSSEITGGEMFKALFVGALLMAVTFGIYAPWFMVKLQKLVTDRTKIHEGGHTIGTLEFVGTGGDLAIALLVGGFLTFITFGIYGAWYQVNMIRYFAKNTVVKVHHKVYAGDFTGTGGELLVLSLIGGFLTTITFGIYSFWFIAKLMKFQADHTVYAEKGRVSVSGFVDEKKLTLEDARKVQERVQPMLQQDDVSRKINDAARLMTARRFEECIRAYDKIAAEHVGQRGTCESQIGAAYYFLSQFDTAILHYELAKKFGADREMMDDNIREARHALEKQRARPRV